MSRDRDEADDAAGRDALQRFGYCIADSEAERKALYDFVRQLRARARREGREEMRGRVVAILANTHELAGLLPKILALSVEDDDGK